MVRAVRFHRTGGPEVLRWEEVKLEPPGRGRVRVRHTAVGLNFIDTYHRTGLYPLDLPAVPGMEAAGVVEEVGEGVTEVREGDRVAYAGGGAGAYAEARNIAADRLAVLPDAVDDETAAAVMLKGLTAWYLVRRTHRLAAGETTLVHAAAGGVGLILCQWAHHLGARVIGTVGTDDKARLAAEHGCDHPVVYTREDFVSRVHELTDGEGVPVVYDSVGRATWQGSLDCLRPLGLMVSYGNASGPVPPFAPNVLAEKGSLFLTRPTLMTYTARREDLLAAANELFDLVERRVIRVEIRQRMPLAEAAEAHRRLEARRTTGSTVLLV